MGIRKLQAKDALNIAPVAEESTIAKISVTTYMPTNRMIPVHARILFNFSIKK